MDNDIYKQKIIDRYQQPQFQGKLDSPSIDMSESNPLCGDWVRFQIRVVGGQVDEVKWRGEGCAISLASADMLAEKVAGLKLDEISELSEDDVLGMLGIELKPSRLKCALLPLGCLRKGIS